MSVCNMCPRACGAERGVRTGVCGAPEEFLVSRVALHPFEEPCLSGKNGSGTVFFGGCNLHCVFCQNRAISGGGVGEGMDESVLEKHIFSLVEQGAHNINLVTPTHYTFALARLLERIKPRLPVPVVWNSGGYESVDALRALDGLVEVYLPDFKYASHELAARYSHASDYPEVALAAICEMHRQRGRVCFDGEGMIQSGVIVRHLVLPTGRKDSMAALTSLAEHLPVADIRLSLMSQFTPDFVDAAAYPELARRVTSFEYDSVVRHALSLGFEGYLQARSSATKEYTPDF